MALDIYNTEGHLDRGRVLDQLDEVLSHPGVKGTAKIRQRLIDLLDECSEGFTSNPLDAPTMTAYYIDACKPRYHLGEGH